MELEPYHEVRGEFALIHISNGEVPAEFCTGEDPNVPTHVASIEQWAASNSAFAARLRTAKAIGALVMLAECKKIADDRSIKVDQKKVMIDARMKVAAIWNPTECNQRTVIEQNTTVRNLTPRQEYVDHMIKFLGMTSEQALARYERETGESLQ